MSTNGYENWAVDLANVGAIYPFQGSEVVLVIIGFVFWIGWHIIQIKEENADFAHDIEHKNDPDAMKNAIERY